MHKIMTRIMILLIFAIFVLEIVNIYFMNKVSTDSIFAVGISRQIEEYDKKNSLLKIEILQNTSYSALSTKVKELGYVEPKDFIYLTLPLRIAAKNNEQP